MLTQTHAKAGRLADLEPVAEDPLIGLIALVNADPRPDKIIFIKGEGTVKFQDVIWAMDQARGAGVKVIGVPPKDTK